MKFATEPRPSPSTPEAHRPWWREAMVWLVISGPAVVVVAGIATAVIAYRGADVIVKDAPAPHEVVRPTGHTPAHAARNHAATAEAPR